MSIEAVVLAGYVSTLGLLFAFTSAGRTGPGAAGGAIASSRIRCASLHLANFRRSRSSFRIYNERYVAGR